MDEEKKAKVISLFAEMRRNEEQRRRRRKVKKVEARDGGTHIINSTIVVCGDGLKEVVAELLASKQRPR